MKALFEIIAESEILLPRDFYALNHSLFVREHLEKLSERLMLFQKEGPWERQPPPWFGKECTPPLKEAYAFFEEAMNCVNRNAVLDCAPLFAEALPRAGITNVLVLMGQRITPGSYTDHRAIPPLRNILLDAASQFYRGKLTVAAREWSKHTQRSKDLFWGEIGGNDEYKNSVAVNFIHRILNESTWWNVFGHFKHETVYEARLPSGHGARWGKCGKEFIGFLEPFMEEDEALEDRR